MCHMVFREEKEIVEHSLAHQSVEKPHKLYVKHQDINSCETPPNFTPDREAKRLVHSGDKPDELTPPKVSHEQARHLDENPGAHDVIPQEITGQDEIDMSDSFKPDKDEDKLYELAHPDKSTTIQNDEIQENQEKRKDRNDNSSLKIQPEISAIHQVMRLTELCQMYHAKLAELDKLCDRLRTVTRRRKPVRQRLNRCEKRFQCELCKTSFNARVKLWLHKRTHSDAIGCDEAFTTESRSTERLKKTAGRQSGKSFTTKNPLTSLVNGRLGGKSYPCDKCETRFAAKQEFSGHTCTVAVRTLRREDLDKTSVTDKDKLLTSRHSSEKTDQRSKGEKSCSNKKRLRIHTGEKSHQYDQDQKGGLVRHTDENPHQCAQCHKTFKTKKDLHKHNSAHCRGKLHKCDQDKKSSSNTDTMTRRTGEKPHQYNQDKKLSLSEGGLMRHTDEKPHPFKTKGDLNKHNNRGKMHKCDECDKAFLHKPNLTAHLRTHNGEKPFKCNECDKAFPMKHHLTVHMRGVHTGDKPHKCKKCNKSFTQTSGLKTHLLTHSGEKPYQCDQCNKAFTQKSDLTKHLIVHSGEKPYKCDLCGISFRQKPHLKRHLGTRTHLDRLSE